MDIICPSCGGTYHETTEEFDLTKVANGEMFRLKRKYGPKGYNWESFPADPATMFGDLMCPWCEGCYVGGDGKVIKLKKGDDAKEEKAQKEGSKGQKRKAQGTKQGTKK